MSRRFFLRLGGLPIATIVVWLAAGSAGAATDVDRTIAEVGRTRVIAIGGADGAEATAADPSILQIVSVLPAADGGPPSFVRVRGRAPGVTTLSLGARRLEVTVLEPRADAVDGAPRIVGPVTGAIVWGRLSVGVEVRVGDEGRLPRVVLRTARGDVAALSDTRRGEQPLRSLRFEIDVTEERPGPLVMRAVAIDAGGRETAGPPVTVQAIEAGAENVTAGEAEGRYDVRRPQRFRDTRMNIGRHRDASGGAYFSNASSQPAVCFPIEVADAGWYQVKLRAGGTRAQGALPTVGIVVDGANASVTNARLLDEPFHELVVGVPFPLDAGSHVLTPYFANDFFVPRRADRNLHLDRIEVVRVASGSSDGIDAASTMAGETNAMMADPGAMMIGADAMMAATDATMMQADGVGEADDVAVDDPYGLTAAPLRVAFVRPLDGQIVPGLLEIEGRCWWDGVERRPAPDVTLFVNERRVGTQRSGAPRFWVDPSAFAAGPNRIRLDARLAGGAAARTPTQTMQWPAAAAAGDSRPPERRHHRFSIHEDAWTDGVAERLNDGHYPKERRAARFNARGRAVLELPDEIEGRYDVYLELLGEHFEGAPVATVTHRRGGETTAVGDVEAPTWWDTRRAGTIETHAGPDALVVAFENDRYEAGRGDRNLLLQAVLLVETAEAEDRTPPVVELTYPGDDHDVFMADAVVVEASDNASLASVELLVDGIATGLTADLNLRPGRVVLPLLTRSLAAGAHAVVVRATDVAGNTTLSEPRSIIVLDRAPRDAGPYRRAVRLLDRFGWGPDGDGLAAILTMGETAWLDDALARGIDDPGDLAAMGAAFPYFTDQSAYATPQRVASHALLTTNPVRSRFVLWAQNHFSTWIRKTGGGRKWTEHVSFSRLGPTTFDRLLCASAESPAMLAYLDQERSFAGRLNENYAREIMELHTLGVDGGYTQADVTSLAALLTGWTASLEGDGRGGGQGAATYTHRFDAALNDGAETVLLGVRFPAAAPGDRFDRTRLALELLAAHPSTARHVAAKLAAHYATSPPPEALVDDLAVTYLETGGDTVAMLRVIARHPAFWNDEPGERVAHALDYGLRLARTTGQFQPWRLHGYLQTSGHGIFDRASPDGYPEADSAYTDSNAMLQRWRLARDAAWPLTTLVPGPVRWGREMTEDEWADRVIDVIAVRLTGDVLGVASYEAARDLIAASAPATRDERVRMVAPFIAQLPEANMR